VRGPAGAIYFAGDTGYSPHFAEIKKRLGPVRLAVLPIGAYKPEWFMSPVHMSPGQAVQASEDLGASTSVAMHFGTFQLGFEGENEAQQALLQALDGKRDRFWVLGFGEGRTVP
jgi:L-ascorbate metabolism protein UlaG (beta-lactamase superfamily)